MLTRPDDPGVPKRWWCCRSWLAAQGHPGLEFEDRPAAHQPTTDQPDTEKANIEAK